MSDLIKIKRGSKTNIPILNLGEPGFTTDTNELFVGGANGNVKIGADIEAAFNTHKADYASKVNQDVRTSASPEFAGLKVGGKAFSSIQQYALTQANGNLILYASGSLNDAKTAGFYNVQSTVTDRPLNAGANGGFLQVFKLNDTSILQIYTSVYAPTGKQFIRYFVSNTWTDWVEQETTLSVDSKLANVAKTNVENNFTAMQRINGYSIWYDGNNPSSGSATNGWHKFPSGLIIQWGVVTNVPSGADTNIWYPIAFPTGVITINATVESAGTAYPASVSSLSPTDRFNIVQSSGAARAIRWFALGF